MRFLLAALAVACVLAGCGVSKPAPIPAKGYPAALNPTITPSPTPTVVYVLNEDDRANLAARVPPLDFAPTPTPTPALPARVTAAYNPSPGRLSEGEMRAVLTAAGWPASLHVQALAVSWCESTWHPGSIAPYDQSDGLGSTGLFQLWSGWYRYAGYDYSQWADPVVNAATAYAVYLHSGWSPWTCQP